MSDSYGYTESIAAELGRKFSTEFGLVNSGGGCMLLRADLADGNVVMVGSAVDGMLLRADERAERVEDGKNDGGFGVGVYRYDAGDDYELCRAYVADELATDADAIAVLVGIGLAFVPLSTGDEYVDWARKADGSVGCGKSRN